MNTKNYHTNKRQRNLKPNSSDYNDNNIINNTSHNSLLNINSLSNSKARNMKKLRKGSGRGHLSE